jgi:hypothetical protein
MKAKIIQLSEPTEILIRPINGGHKQPELFPPVIYKPKNPELSRDDFWWEAYNAYLDHSPIWRYKHDLILIRDPICTGCGCTPSTQAHHLKYPKAWPGSEEWSNQEKLFDLTGVCDQCHIDIHPKLQQQLLFDKALALAA